MSDGSVGASEFADLVARHEAGFVGREWLVAEVESRLDRADCRFVLLTGAPGVGKTAFLAHLAATHRDWPRYFVRRDSHQLLLPGDATTFLLSIGEQLAAVHPELFRSGNVEITADQDIGALRPGGEAIAVCIRELLASPFNTTKISADQRIREADGSAVAVEVGRLVADARLRTMQDLQYLALIDPCRALAEADPSARVVVLVDALDELRYSPAEHDIARVLGELPEVPSNLRFVLSARPDAVLGRLQTRADVCVLPLDVAGEDNRRDLRTFAERAVADAALSAALAQERLTPNTFLAALLGRANGNFLYLTSVLGAIAEAGSDPARADHLRRLLRVDQLPERLGALYSYFLASISRWAEKRGFEAAWRRFISPLLGVLAVAQAPVCELELTRFTGLKRSDVQQLLRELRQFVPQDAQSLYRIYHASFAEYLLDAEHNKDHWIDSRTAHEGIARHYLAGWVETETSTGSLDLAGLTPTHETGGFGIRPGVCQSVCVFPVSDEDLAERSRVCQAPGRRRGDRVH